MITEKWTDQHDTSVDGNYHISSNKSGKLIKMANFKLDNEMWKVN